MEMDKEKGYKAFSMRMNIELSSRIEEMAKMANRSFNGQIVELLNKGIDLYEAEKHYMENRDPLTLVRIKKDGSEDGESKHSSASGYQLESDEDKKNKQNRELA